MRFRAPSRRGPMLALNLATMLDATFLLLGYFLVTAATDRLERRLDASLAGEGAAVAPADLEPVVIEVGGEPGRPWYRVGERAVAERASLLALLRQLDPRSQVRVRASSGPSVEAVTTAIQIARDAGFTEVAYDPGS